jgi:pimeloyl-ACP methyl ester carboxylesterase
MYRKLIIFALLVVAVLLSGLVVAQDEEWTCDDGPNDVLNAAQAAFDDGDRDMAWQLAAHAEALCMDDAGRLRKAKRLRSRLDPSIPDMIAFAQPGKVNIGDYELFMVCMGEGSPTIIFENGLGMLARTAWEDVHPAVSTFTRACRYDRLGVMPSDPVPADIVRTTQDQVDDLIILLEIAEIEPPYVLVGYDIAGLNISLFVDQYPDLVEGIVLVDASHPYQFERWAETDPEFEVPFAVGEPTSRERIDVITSLAQAADIHDFGDRPLAVVTAASASRKNRNNPIWMELQEEYVTYSTNSRHIIAERGPNIAINQQPVVVVEAILWVLDEIWAAEEDEIE